MSKVFLEINSNYGIIGSKGGVVMPAYKKIKQQLLEQYPYRIELHAHTHPVSGCSCILPEEMPALLKGKGYDAVVITNHFVFHTDGTPAEEALDFYMSGYEQTKAAADQYGIRVILGAEIRFEDHPNDYLLFGVDRDILRKCYDYLQKGVELFRKEVPLPDSLFLQAHPFRDGLTRVDPALLDGIETFNMHPHHNSRVGLAVKFAVENGLTIQTVGTDLHEKDEGHEGICALRTAELPEDSFDIVRILRSGEYIFEVGEENIVLP